MRRSAILVGIISILVINLSISPVYSREIQPLYQEAQNAVITFILNHSQATGTFNLKDPRDERIRRLSFERFHRELRFEKDVYTLRINMIDLDSSEILEVDFDLETSSEGLTVMDVRYHLDEVQIESEENNRSENTEDINEEAL